jgi:hypothetical protein
MAKVPFAPWSNEKGEDYLPDILYILKKKIQTRKMPIIFMPITVI